MAYEFDGTENLRLATPITAYPFSLACWFRTEDITKGDQVVVALTDDSGFNDYQELMFVGNAAPNSREVRAYSRTNSPGVLAVAGHGAAAVDAGEWHHLAGVWASATSRIVYIDGTASTENTTSVGFAASIDLLSIGNNDRSGAGWHFFIGGIAEIGVWNVALSPAEIAALARRYSPRLVRPQSQVLYVPAIRSTRDLISGVALTEVGTPTIATHPPMIYPFRSSVGVSSGAIVDFTATAAAVCTTSAAASVQRNLTAAAAAAAATSGAASVQVALTATAAAAATTAGAASVQRNLTAAAAAAAATSGAASRIVALTATAAAASETSGEGQVGQMVDFEAVCAVTSQASAEASVTRGLTAAAAAQSVTQATAVKYVGFEATASVQSQAAASSEVIRSLLAAAAVTSAAGAAASVLRLLNAIAAVQSSMTAEATVKGPADPVWNPAVVTVVRRDPVITVFSRNTEVVVDNREKVITIVEQ